MKLSIIIPVYNAEKTIGRCVDSILPQMTEEMELLLLNDGSKDASLSVIRDLAAAHPGTAIRIFDQANSGAAVTRNRGIREAEGEWITFIDNDDFVDEGYFRTFLQAADASLDMILGGYRRVSDVREQFHVDASDSNWYPFTVTAPWARIYRRDFLLENDLQFLSYPMGEDVWFNLACYAASDRIRIISCNGYNWYYNEESVSNTVQRGFSDRIVFADLLEKLYAACRMTEIGEERKRYFQYFFVRYVIWYLLFSGRSASGKAFAEEYKKSFSWLRNKGIPLRFPAFRREMSCERMSVRVSVAVFLLLHKLHLTGLFAAVYCRG